MFPILLDVAGHKIHSYGFFMALGYLAGLMLLYFLAKRRGMSPAPFLDIAFIAITTGIIGARLLFVLTNLRYFMDHPQEIFDFWRGGLVFYGGFLFAGLFIVLYLKWKKLPFAESMDIMAPPLALSHALGRVGCFAAGCCHGSYCPYPWGAHFDSDFVSPSLRGLALHPTQLYEAGSLFLLAGLLYLFVERKSLRPGYAAIIYLMGYAVIRAIVEIFRGDQVRGFVLGGWLSTSQAISLLILLCGFAFFIRGFRRNH